MSEETKVCTKCGEEKPIEKFGNHKQSKDGKRPCCKKCHRERNKQYREENRDYIKTYQKNYYETNKEYIKERTKKYREENSEWKRQYDREYYENNKDRLNKTHKKWQKSNREYVNFYYRNRRKGDFDYKMKCQLRSMLHRLLGRTGESKESSTIELLGYNEEDLAKRIGFNFKCGMTWSNHGEWHIDHKIPIQHFLDKGETRPHIINALSNLQPLWAVDNCSKNSKSDY